MTNNKDLNASGFTHDETLTWAGDVAEAFADYRTDIIPLYPHLNAAAEAALAAAIATFGKTPTDETLDDQQEALRVATEDAQKALLTRWQQFRPTLNVLYPANEAKQNAWGADDYEKARTTEGGLRAFAENWIASFTTYAADPGVSALPALFQKAAVEGLYEDWKTKDKAHHGFEKNRPVKTQERLLQKNAVLAAARPFAEAGKGAFITNPTKRALFYQPRPAGKGATASVTLKLQPGATLAAETLDLSDPTSHLSVRVLDAAGQPAATAAVQLGRAAAAGGPALGATRDVAGSGRTVFPLADFGAAGPVLTVRNLTQQSLTVKVSVVE